MGCFPVRPKFVAAVLQPWPSELMKAYEVSTLVNSPENDTAECIEPVSPNQAPKRQLPLL
jgi:putative SOS response-associated peptidase YedK